MADPARRRLPVLQSTGEDEGPPRPRWQWIVIGAAATLLAWLLLAMIANPIAARAGGDAELGLPPTGRALAALVVANVLALSLAALGGGWLVGRFGGLARAREAALAGLSASAGGCMLALGDPTRTLQGGVLGWALLLVVVAGIGAGAAWLGGKRGLRGREPRPSPGS